MVLKTSEKNLGLLQIVEASYFQVFVLQKCNFNQTTLAAKYADQNVSGNMSLFWHFLKLLTLFEIRH